MNKYSLVCPFLIDDPLCAYGVEFGLLFARMKSQKVIKDYFCLGNQERILLLANRLGWQVKKLKPFGKDWFWIAMKKDRSRKNGTGQVDMPLDLTSDQC